MGEAIITRRLQQNLNSNIELNFDIVAYTTEEELNASTPTENTIGIITDTQITCWSISVIEPETISEGMVWIRTSEIESTIELNVLKENSIYVFPISVAQYIDGTWVSKTFNLYQDDKWINIYPNKLSILL